MSAEPNPIIAPFNAKGRCVTTAQIVAAVEIVVAIPDAFNSGVVLSALLPDEDDLYVRSEASNRLFQRWRKMGLATYSKRLWTLTPGSGETMRLAAFEARKDPSHAA